MPAAAAPFGTITKFSPISIQNPHRITAGPDGNLWFTSSQVLGPAAGPGQIGRITTAGVIMEFSVGIASGVSLGGITAGPDGNLWFTETAGFGSYAIGGDRIGRITRAGVVTEFSTGITTNGGLVDIAAGPDGNLWFTEGFPGNRIGRITLGGIITEFPMGVGSDARPMSISAGPDGNLWFTEDASRIGRVTPAGVVTEFTQGITPFSAPAGIAAGPDGNLWFTEGSAIGRITPAGVVTEFPLGTVCVGGFVGCNFTKDPTGITAGPDGSLWFIESIGNIGRITPEGAITEFPAAPGTTQGVLDDIAAGSDGNIWFTEPGNPSTLPPRKGRIGRFTLTVDGQGKLKFAKTGRRFRITSLRANGLSRGARLQIRCLRGCRVRKTVTATTATRDFTRLFRGIRLPAKSVIALRITRTGLLGREVRWTLPGRRLVKTMCQISFGGAVERCTKS